MGFSGGLPVSGPPKLSQNDFPPFLTLHRRKDKNKLWLPLTPLPERIDDSTSLARALCSGPQ
jgi:hypothetical protein